MNQTVDTIAAIATPLGFGGLGVIRVSGPKSILLVSGFFKPTSLLSAPANTLHHGFIMDKGLEIDEVMVSVFRTPHSYTGEDVIEISCHGNPVILRRVLSVCLQSGARLARPGEFTQRAFVNGKMDLIQAESVASLIQANSESARQQATYQLQGLLSERVSRCRQGLLEILAQVEANLDFVEDEIPVINLDRILQQCQQWEMYLDSLLATSVRGRILRDGLKVVLVGEPNAGKSSLFNALLASDRAIVTNVPGTTRDTIEALIDWESFPIILTDTAGLRPTSDEVELHGQKRTQEALRQADVILYIQDGSLPAPSTREQAWNQFHRQKTILVLNKADLGIHPSFSTIDPNVSYPTVMVSAAKSEGLDDLRKKIIQMVEPAPIAEGQIVITHLRHEQHLENSRTHLKKAAESLQNKRTEEAIALDIRQAIEELDAITGQCVSKDVLDKIFSSFCIGK